MDQRVSATPTAAEWYSLGPSWSAKRSLFSVRTRRRPDPVIHDGMTSPEQSALGSNWQRHDWVTPGALFNRSLSMHVKSSRNVRMLE